MTISEITEKMLLSLPYSGGTTKDFKNILKQEGVDYLGL